MPAVVADNPKLAWLERVLGLRLPGTPAAPARTPSVTAPDGRKLPVASAIPSGPAKSYRNPDGRKFSVVAGADGRVAFKADRPPLQEVTFSGGGGKGIALPGAAQALAQSGALAEVKVFRGASVGSMTAAVLGAGITAEKLTEVSATPMMPIVKGGEIVPIDLTGDKLEAFVRDTMCDATAARIRELEATLAARTPPDALDPAVQAILDKAEAKKGITFGDLRTLSAVIPAVKEVVISATMLGDNSASGQAIEKNGKPQLAIFSADTEPDMDVARAVHASAALPPVFKPVDLQLSSGVTARFEDGGVMNNAPTADLVGAAREVDPIPPKGNMTFVFEGKSSEEILKGQATATDSKLGDWLAKAPYGANEYATNRGLADRPEDVVMVPLKFKGKWDERTDFTGAIGGLVNFNVKKKARDTLQEMTKETTGAFLAKRQEPETHEFASAEQMYCCIGRDDLVTLAGNDTEAAVVLAFRDAVVAKVKALETLAAAGKPEAVDAAAAPLLTAIQDLATAGPGGDADRLAFVGRELNRSGKLDPFLTRAKAKADPAGAPAVLQAGIAMADSLATKARAQFVLREVIYPKMVTEGTKGAGGKLLAQVDGMLRSVDSPAAFDAALALAIDHFRNKSDITGRHHHRQFAADLTTYLMG